MTLSHVGNAVAAIEAGLCEVVVISYASSGRSWTLPATDFNTGRTGPGQYEVPFGASTISAYALAATRYMHEHGLRSEQLAQIADLNLFVTTTFDSSIGTAAALHLAASLPWDAAHGLGTGEHLAADVTATTMLASGGRIALPDAPGLGVDVSEDALDAVASGPWVEVTG